MDDNQQLVLRQLGRFNDDSQRLRSISFIIQACLVPKEEDDEGSHYERQKYYENLANLGKFLRGAHGNPISSVCLLTNGFCRLQAAEYMAHVPWCNQRAGGDSCLIIKGRPLRLQISQAL
jgi:hypothetical protein